MSGPGRAPRTPENLMKEAAGKYREAAGRAYAAGQDNDARVLREAARSVQALIATLPTVTLTGKVLSPPSDGAL